MGVAQKSFSLSLLVLSRDL